jgi:hypothetical protein
MYDNFTMEDYICLVEDMTKQRKKFIDLEEVRAEVHDSVQSTLLSELDYHLEKCHTLLSSIKNLKGDG